MTVQSYRDLIAWQKSFELAAEVFCRTRHFPKEEIYGLSSQIRRAAMSIPSNIAEGQGRMSRGEFMQFLGHARGSLFEVETQLLLAQRLTYLDDEDSNRLLAACAEVGRVLNGLICSLRS